MRYGWFLALLAGSFPATAAADAFVEVAGGVMTPGGRPAWANLADTSPKLAVRAGSMDRNWGDAIVSFDWTPVRTGVPDSSTHRFRMLSSYGLNTRIGALNLSARAGVGLDILRVHRMFECKTLVGYAAELGAGLWFATGSVEIGGDIGIPVGLNGNATVGDLVLDSYVSVDVDVLLGVRHIWR